MERIYAEVNRTNQIHKVLTGYQMYDETVRRIEGIASFNKDIDIGYCAADPVYWHGRHGILKGKIGEAFRTVL